MSLPNATNLNAPLNNGTGSNVTSPLLNGDAANRNAPLSSTLSTPSAGGVVPSTARKVTLTHNGQQITVGVNELNTHLSQGDKVVKYLDQNDTEIPISSTGNANQAPSGSTTAP